MNTTATVADVDEQRLETMASKVMADFDEHGKQITPDAFQKKLDECMIEARRQIGTP